MATSQRPHQIAVKVDKNGGFLIPLAFRQALGVKAGDEVILYWKEGELRITIAKGESSKRKGAHRTR